MTLSHQERAVRAARKHAAEAIDALLGVLRDPRTSPAIRARAASLILAAGGLIGSFGQVGTSSPLDVPAHHAEQGE